MKHKNVVVINEDYDDWKIKGLLAEVVGYDRDKRYLVKLLENSQTDYLNVGDTIWLKPHWLDGIDEVCNRFTAIHKFPYDLEDSCTKKDRWKEYKKRSRRDKISYWVSYGDVRLQDLTRNQAITKVKHALQNNLDFDIIVSIETKWGFMSGLIMESSFVNNDYHVHSRNFKEVTKVISGLQRKLVKIVESY